LNDFLDFDGGLGVTLLEGDLDGDLLGLSDLERDFDDLVTGALVGNGVTGALVSEGVTPKS
jgi:hypothetical protein